jgi:hypothetical protein
MAWMEQGNGREAPPGAQAVHTRYRTPQDFALGLACQMHRSLVLSLLENGPGAPPLLTLALGDPARGWHVCCGTIEEIAHKLHTLGMHDWATRRRQSRQRKQGR